MTDAQSACELVIQYLPELPPWPQLPRRSPLEDRYLQFCEGLLGIRETAGRLTVEPGAVSGEALERVYMMYLRDEVDAFAISAERASGLHAMSTTIRELETISAVKGQMIGPVSLGLEVHTPNERALIEDPLLADILAKELRMKAAWQERLLGSSGRHVALFIDEPLLSWDTLTREHVSSDLALAMIEEVLQGLDGLKGIHVCQEPPWNLLLQTSVEVVSFDAVHYADTLEATSGDLQSFLNRGGILSWGLVPVDRDTLAAAEIEDLLARLVRDMGVLARQDIGFQQVLEQSLVTPACGLEHLSVEEATRAMELAAMVSTEMRKRYAGEL